MAAKTATAFVCQTCLLLGMYAACRSKQGKHRTLKRCIEARSCISGISIGIIYCECFVARMGEERGAYRVLVGKPEGKRPLGRPRRRWVDNIIMDLQEVGCGYVDWIGLAQDRDRWRTLVSAVLNLRVPLNAGNFLTSCKPVSFSRWTLHHGVSK